MNRILISLVLISLGCQNNMYEPSDPEIPKSITYSGDSLTNIAVPVGGIGTGDILIGGRGNIQALEIFNRAAMNDQPYMTFFSLWFSKEGEDPETRILEGEVPENMSGTYGVSRRQLEGIPRFRNASFSSEYPLINVKLSDEDVPLNISAEFYNPLIPLAVDKSSYPVAVFNWTIENPTDHKVSVSVALNLGNPLKNSAENQQLTSIGNTNDYFENDYLKGVFFENSEQPGSAWYGNLLMTSDFKNTEVQTSWYEGAWWDDATVFWDDFKMDGRINERKEKVRWEGSNWYGSNQQTIVGCVSLHADLEPGESITLPFYLSWYIPNRILESTLSFGNREVANALMKNYYANFFNSAEDVMIKFLEESEELYQLTGKYVDLLHHSSYPEYVIDALSANTAALKTNLLMRTGEGYVHGFEGLGPDSGCCPGNCTHVWNYAQTMAALFPELEKKVREVSFLHDTFDNGYQCFRTVFPLGDYWFRSVAADGQMGNIIRVYREWKNTGDSAWLAKLWPKIKVALEFAWKGSGEVSGKYNWQEQARIPWDPNKEGVMRGDQHNTYDINFFGPNMMTGSAYLGALKACSEMAEYMNEPDKAAEYKNLYKKGLKTYDSLLWNGSWYEQKVEVIEGVDIPERLKSPPDEEGKVIPKYQFAGGCLTDQLLGQFIAFNAGLGFVVDSSRVRQAMKSVYEHNFIRDFSTFDNVQRVFAINDESGIVICSWPNGDRPRIPFVYSDEVWTGIEYGAAVNMINAGLIDEGLDVVKAVRERYRGYNRNPWGEVESGMYYARSLAAWGILPALSGFQYDGVNDHIEFKPKLNEEAFNTFWVCGDAWGNISLNQNGIEITVAYGTLALKSFGMVDRSVSAVKLDRKDISFQKIKDKLEFEDLVLIKEGSLMNIAYN